MNQDEAFALLTISQRRITIHAIGLSAASPFLPGFSQSREQILYGSSSREVCNSLSETKNIIFRFSFSLSIIFVHAPFAFQSSFRNLCVPFSGSHRSNRLQDADLYSTKASTLTVRRNSTVHFKNPSPTHSNKTTLKVVQMSMKATMPEREVLASKCMGI